MESISDDELKIIRYISNLKGEGEWIRIPKDKLCRELDMPYDMLTDLLFRLDAKKLIVLNRLPAPSDLYTRITKEIDTLNLKLLTNEITETEYLENMKVIEQKLGKVVSGSGKTFNVLPLVETLNLFRQLNQYLDRLKKLAELKKEELSNGEEKAKDKIKNEINNKITIICDELGKYLTIILERIGELEEEKSKLQERIDELKVRMLIGELNEREHAEMVRDIKMEMERINGIIQALLSIDRMEGPPEEVKDMLEILEARLLIQEITREVYEKEKERILASFKGRIADLQEVKKNIKDKYDICEKLKMDGILSNKSYETLNNLYGKLIEKINTYL
jgi:signal transduction histidine kinase